MKLIEWLNGITKLGKTTMDEFQNNINDAFNEFSLLPIGVGFDYFGTTAPEDYMFADGREISRTDYAELFEIIGTTYGTGDGSTTFNLPDKRSRVSIMKGDSDTLGAKVGSNSVTLKTANLPKVNLGTVVTSVSPTSKGTWDVEKNIQSVTSVTSNSKALSFGNDSPTAIDNRQSSLICNYIIKVK